MLSLLLLLLKFFPDVVGEKTVDVSDAVEPPATQPVQPPSHAAKHTQESNDQTRANRGAGARLCHVSFPINIGEWHLVKYDSSQDLSTERPGDQPRWF